MSSAPPYPPPDARTPSPGGAAYRVDPARGDDANPAGKPWRSLAKINALALAPGDRVEIAPGLHDASLNPAGTGTAARPVEIVFLPGRHEIGIENAIRLTPQISNGNDFPDRPKAVGILVRDARHIRFTGENSDIVFGGTMIMLMHERAEDITYDGLNFDLKRPTVSEFRVRETAENSAVIEIAEGSDYEIRNGALTWVGDLGDGWVMVQEAIPEEGRCWRKGKQSPLDGATAEEIAPRTVRLTYPSGHGGLIKGRQFQFRHTFRDCVGGFNDRSRNLAWRNCNFHALTGLGLVSQFTENLTFERVNFVPPAGTLRTCPAWADMLHFSNCRGRITVTDCRMSGSQDDPINVHGTHLQLVEKVGADRVRVRYMHRQTYGFTPFQPGDIVEFVSRETLRAYSENVVTGVECETPKDWLLTLQSPAADFAVGDVVDNATWHPDLEVRNCFVTMDATRGFLITTRGRVLVEGNTFQRTTMSAIDISDDANHWFESGPVRDVTIRGNRFIECGEPVVYIHPENPTARPGEPVHRNIRILDNEFVGGGISARSVQGLTIAGNRFTAAPLPVQTVVCTDIVVERNEVGVKKN